MRGARDANLSHGSDRRGDIWDTGREILNRLEPRLPRGPWLVDERVKADMEIGELVCQGPLATSHVNPRRRHLTATAHDQKLEANSLGDALKHREQRLEIRK
jgi:hypothetical protein